MALADRDALVAFYDATDGAKWSKNTNWKTDADLGLWHGVEVDDKGRVVGLQLHDRNIRGGIPKELGHLSELKYLVLSSNKLTGGIPKELGHLSELKDLVLKRNRLTGGIPKELGHLSELKYLVLSRNKLTGGIPKELGHLSELDELNLSYNKLTGEIPRELGKLTALTTLHLERNDLSGGIPKELGDLSELKELGLQLNKLTGKIPRELGKMTALISLQLEGNDLSGDIPKELGNLSKLWNLYLSGNNLTGKIPRELGKMTALISLQLERNDLSGDIPKELGNLSKLWYLYLSGNNLTGDIPKELGDLSELRVLSLSGSKLTGDIPRELGKLTALIRLHLERNDLSGHIPPELGNLAKLELLNLSGNQLKVLWDTLGREKAGSMATPPGTLPVALAALLDLLGRVLADLSQNPWEHPPEPFVADGLPAVRNYFEAIFRSRTTTVTRPLKVVIVGKETVGKTSLRRSIKTGRPSKTKEGGVESTVHVDVEDHEIEGHPIRMFDCAGQVVYYGLLQLFLTPRALYLLVWDAEDASKMVLDAENALDLESLAIARWLRNLTFRVPDANVVLVGNKWDLAASSSKDKTASEVECQSREWLASWTEKARGHQPRGLSLEAGVSLVSCAPSFLGISAPAFGGGTRWPCDKNDPGLLGRITHNADGEARAATMLLPQSYHLALEMLEDLASCSRRDGAPGLTRSSLEEKWQAKVDELKTAGNPVAAPEAAMSGAILIRKWEGGLVAYGSYIFLDVQWFATVLDPLLSHKRDSFGNLDLGGRRVTNITSLHRLENENVLEPQLAQELWGAELAPHLLFALKSAGLTFPLPKDPQGGLVILLRMATEPPADYSIKLNSQLEQADHQGRKHDLGLHVECSFSLGLPPGFVERLLARCCHLGLPYPFWRSGALIVGQDEEQGLFSLSLDYSAENNILTVYVYGGREEVHVWGTLSKVLSVMIKMLAEFEGLPCELTFFCPLHKDKDMPIRTTDAQPGSPLVEDSFCQLCIEQKAGKGLLAVALQVVGFSDEEFFDANLREKFAENAENVAVWPGSNLEVSGPAPVQTNPVGPSSQATPQPTPISPDSQTPWYQDLRTWVGAAIGVCLAVFGVLAAKDDDDSRVWGVFLGLAILLLVVELVLIARVNKRFCFAARVQASSAGNEPGGAARV